VRFHQGTAAAAARLRILDAADGDTLQGELFFREEVVLAPGDRFILRRPAPVDTLGGGIVVDVRPPRVKQRSAAAFGLEALELDRALALRLERAGAGGREAAELRVELGRAPEEIDRELRALETQGESVRVSSRWFDGEAWRAATTAVLQRLRRFHLDHPTHAGTSRETLRADVASEMPQEAWRELLARLAAQREIRLSGEEVALTGHRVVLDREQSELSRRIDEGFRRAGLDPPELEEVVGPTERASAEPIVKLLLREGKLVRIHGGRLFHGEALEELRAKLRRFAVSSRTIDVATFKQLAGVTRKNAIPLLEQLDVERSTRRRGNLREILLKSGEAGGGSGTA
jgi:selenocysteine-specific elongation factor